MSASAKAAGSPTAAVAAEPGGSGSHTDGTSLTTTLRRLAMASITASGLPSYLEGRTTTSAAAYQSLGSGTSPAKKP
jgi:hypothetical protein